MDTKEKIELANQILNNNPMQGVKVLKTDNSIIERKGSIILTEDNRELLRD
jgi:Na+-translocating ferredoxin:NAD+ oxidoreductase RnfC subunit